MSIAKMMKAEFNDGDYSLSGIGGVEKGADAAEFILLGANTVQVGPKYSSLVGFFGITMCFLVNALQIIIFLSVLRLEASDL